MMLNKKTNGFSKMCFSIKSVSRLVVVLFVVALSVASVTIGASAQELRPAPRQQALIGDVVDVVVTAEEVEEARRENAEKYSGGAALRTDPELEELLRRATLFADEGSYRNATLLWQKVLTESGDSLITRDGETYFSLTTEVEATIAQLPPDGLRQYRITADGEARAALAAAESEEEGLRHVVREFFLSSFGDEAAYQLGCLAMDRYDFLTAQRMFRKILENYPDPNIPLADVWIRLAVATARVGDRDQANDALAKAIEAGAAESDALYQLVSTDVETAPNQLLSSSADTVNWTNQLGGPSRKGAMPKLAQGTLGSDLAGIWTYNYSIDSLFASGNDNNSNAYASRLGGISYGSARPVTPASMTATQLAEAWKKNSWNPTGRMLIADGKVIFKTKNDIVCWDLDESTDEPVWRSLWLNAFEMDDASQQMMMTRNAYGVSNSAGQPNTAVEVLLFGDVIHQSMSIAGDMVLTIEGERYSRYGGSPKTTTSNANQSIRYGTVPRRTRTNWLTAYDLHSGKLLWHTAARAMFAEGEVPISDATGDSSAEEVADTVNELQDGELGFMAAPIPYGRMLLVPVSDGGSIWIHALSADRGGEVVWASYLCDEPSGGSEAWSPVGMALEGRDLYVVCGTGVIFSLDAATGEVRFARRYVRDGEPDQTIRQFNNTGTKLDLKGWDEDMIIPYGNSLVVMASDHDELFAVHRQTGDVIWRAPRSPFDDEAKYGMGIVNGKLYCAGPQTAICYDLNGEGRLGWAHRIDGTSFGRGMVTNDAVYLPIDNSILTLDLDSGKPKEQVGVKLMTGTPVGNLYSDGTRLWTISMNHVLALGNLDQQLALLERSINAGEAAALIERAGLFVETSRLDEALADLESYYDQVASSESRVIATKSLIEAMEGMQLFQRHPNASLELLSQHGVVNDAVSPSDRALILETAATRLYSFEQAITALETEDVSASFDLLLKFAQAFPLPPLHQGMRLKLESSVADIPVEPLVALTNSDNEQVAAFGLEMLSRTDSPKLVELARTMAESESATIRLTAARALCERRELEGVQLLLAMLESADVKTRATARHSLRALTQAGLKFDPLASEEVRAEQTQQWRAWVAQKADGLTYHLPLPPAEARFGRFLVASNATGEVIEFNSQHEEVWRKKLPDVQAVQGLPNGNLLVGYYAMKKVAEIDRDGETIWEKSNLPGFVSSVERLENGNTLVVCSQPGSEVLEIDPSGNIVWRVAPGRTPHCARRLANGNTLVSLMGNSRVVELNRDGKEVWTVEDQKSVNGVRRLANGDTLFTLPYLYQVTQVNKEGNRVWSAQINTQVFDVERLPSGNTILSTSQGVVELDKGGEEVWRSEFRSMCKGLHAY